MHAKGKGFYGAGASFSAYIKSIDTNVKDRDAHLMSDDFFNADTHPKLTLKKGVMKKINLTEFELKGDMTIR